jgi:hypothetical protein
MRAGLSATTSDAVPAPPPLMVRVYLGTHRIAVSGTTWSPWRTRPRSTVSLARTADLLRHEQGHYDIVALLARNLYKELTGWN